MAKVRTLSRTFLKGHPRAGEPTYFVEQVLHSLDIEWNNLDYLDLLHELNPKKQDLVYEFWISNGFTGCLCEGKKLHTIRNGHHFKTGDKIQLAVWSGKPYASPQIKIAPELEIVQVYDFDTRLKYNACWLNGIYKKPSFLKEIALNDGLSLQDFKDWFKFPSYFSGQIICWKDPKY